MRTPSPSYCRLDLAPPLADRFTSRLRAISAIRPYTLGLCLTWLPGRISPVPHCSVPTCHRLRPRRGPTFVPVWIVVCLPSPRLDRLGPLQHLSADNVTRLLRSLI